MPETKDIRAVQGMDYAYTLQGWLKGINSDRLTPETDMGQDGLDGPGNPNALVGRDAFGESIGYYGDGDFSAVNAARWDNSGGNRPFAPVGDPQTATGTLHDAYNPLYNGNIAHTVNALQPWGGWASPTQPAQVLAQVYRYDQLNRLKQAQGVEGLTSANTWDGVTDATADRYKSEYWYDANGNIDTLARFDRDGAQYDGFNYRYRRTADGRLRQNRLYELHDGADEDNLLVNAGADEDAEDIKHHTGAFDPEDPAINTAYNYGYDELGNLVRDDREGITHIEWTVAGKVKSVVKSTGPSISFRYGAGGQRISKTVGDPNNGGYREHYLRDAQGNIMAIYRYTNDGTASTKLVERPLYGSSRVGSYAEAQEVAGAGLLPVNYTHPLQAAAERYELTDHLGNVATVVSGRLLPMIGPGIQYQAEVVTASGYEPFGALLPGRNWRQPLGPPPPPVTPKGTLVITELSNGPGGNCEYVELYVTKCSLYPDATEVDVRGWIVDDNSGNFNTSGSCGTGVGISAGHLRFADVAAWASVPVGSVIVLYNGNDNCYAFTAQESGTGGQYIVDVNSTTLIERTSLGTGATPNSGGDCGYCGNSYTATGNTTWGSVLGLGNTADAVQVRCPDCPDAEAGFFHGVGYGSGFGGLTAGAHDAGGAYISGLGTGHTYELTGSGCSELGDGGGWTRTTAPAAGTPPASAGVVDAGVLAWLDECAVPCCGSFEAPVLAQRQGYRFGFNGQEKDDEIFGAVGTAMGSEFCEYDTRTGRRWNMDPYAVRMPTISPYSYALNNPIMLKDPEGDFPIIPWLLKASASAGADMLLQASMIYLTDDNVETFGQALSKVDHTDVAISFLQGLNPFKVPGGAMGEAALVGFSDVIIGAGRRSFNGEDITTESIAQDFFIGFFSQLAGDKASELLSNPQVRAKLKSLLGKRADELDVFRVFGGDSPKNGWSYTDVDPRTVPDYRDKAGLPSGGESGSNNTGEFLLEGTTDRSKIIKEKSADPLDGNKGGLKELIINPKDVKEKRVTRVQF